MDTAGLLLTVLITAASVQDRDAAKPLLWNLKKAFPKIRLAWADGIYAGKSSGSAARDRPHATQLFRFGTVTASLATSVTVSDRP